MTECSFFCSFVSLPDDGWFPGAPGQCAWRVLFPQEMRTLHARTGHGPRMIGARPGGRLQASRGASKHKQGTGWLAGKHGKQSRPDEADGLTGDGVKVQRRRAAAGQWGACTCRQATTSTRTVI